MFKVKPESPVTVEGVLLASGHYTLHYKDEDVCSLVPKDRNSGCRPICIPQKAGSLGLSSEIVGKMMFDAGIVEESVYADLLTKVKTKQQADYDAQTKHL